MAHRTAVDHLGADDSDPRTHRLVQATLDLARGLGLADVLSDDSRRRAEIVKVWASVLDASLALDATTTSTSTPASTSELS